MAFTLLLGSSAALVGLIWLVQRVQYPGFHDVPREAFAHYHAAHCRRITEVVGPLMLLQLVTALLWLSDAPNETVRWVTLALIAAAWISTAFVQVPLHQKITESDGDPTAAITSLVRTNWIRTGAWTVQTALLMTHAAALGKGPA